MSDESAHVILGHTQRKLREVGALIAQVRESRHDGMRYSMARHLNGTLQGRLDGIELEVQDGYEASGLTKYSPLTAFIPVREIVRAIVSDRGMRTLQPYQSSVTGSGPELIQTDFRPDLFIGYLFARSRVRQLGAAVIPGNKGDLQIPKMASGSTGYWLGTTGSAPVVSAPITESEGSFDTGPAQVAPLLMGARGVASRLLMRQSPRLAEYVISTDLLTVSGVTIDAAAISGATGGSNPVGVVNTTGVHAVSGTTFSQATAVTAVQDIAAANGVIDPTSLGWIAPPATAGLLANRQKVTGFPNYIWSGSIDSGSINGLPALSSTNVPASTAIAGDWSQVLILTWGEDAPVAVEFNPFQNFSNGDVGYRILLPANIVIRHPESFSVVSSIT
jgi:HK97 family phage major capsid protein